MPARAFDEVYAILNEFGFTAHVRPRGEEAKAIKHIAGFKARRWVVERAHSWMNRFRRRLDSLGQEAPELPSIPAFRLWLDCLSGCRVIWIGFKWVTLQLACGKVTVLVCFPWQERTCVED
jgi:hypothetical protein